MESPEFPPYRNNGERALIGSQVSQSIKSDYPVWDVGPDGNLPWAQRRSAGSAPKGEQIKESSLR